MILKPTVANAPLRLHHHFILYLVFALPARPIRRLYSRGFCLSNVWRQCACGIYSWRACPRAQSHVEPVSLKLLNVFANSLIRIEIPSNPLSDQDPKWFFSDNLTKRCCSYLVKIELNQATFSADEYLLWILFRLPCPMLFPTIKSVICAHC